jgi:ankyrin repeat protein
MAQPLLDIVRTGDIVAVRTFLWGSDFDFASPEAEAALALAVAEGYFAIVQLLVQCGVNVNSSGSRDEWTPLHNAIENYQIDVVAYLLENGAELDLPDQQGNTALHWAIDIEVDSWQQDYRPGKPIEIAITTLLINKGANLNAKNNRGQTPLDWAVDMGHHQAAALLRSAGAQQGFDLPADTARTP